MIEEQEDRGEAEKVRQVRVQVQRTAGQHHDRHHRCAHHGNVAAHEDGIEDERRRDEQRPGDRRRFEPRDEPEDEAGHQRHLRAREGENVIGPRDAECFGRLGLYTGAVPDRHRTHEALLRTGKDVREDRFPRPLASAGRRVAKPAHVAPSGLRDEAAALDVAEDVGPVAPRLRRGVVRARSAESMGQAEDGPRFDAIALDDRQILGGAASHVEAHAAGQALILPAKLKALDLENDLEPVARAAVRDGDAVQRDRRLDVLVGRRPLPERGRVVAGCFRRRGASGHGKGCRGQCGRRGHAPRRQSEQQKERGQGHQDPGRLVWRVRPGLRAQRYRDGKEQQRARFGHPVTIAIRLRPFRVGRPVSELSHWNSSGEEFSG